MLLPIIVQFQWVKLGYWPGAGARNNHMPHAFIILTYLLKVCDMMSCVTSNVNSYTCVPFYQ